MFHDPFAQEAGQTGFPDLRDHLAGHSLSPGTFKICSNEQCLWNCLTLSRVYCLVIPQVSRDARVLLPLLELMTQTQGE